jgi:chromosome segregation ATPase
MADPLTFAMLLENSHYMELLLAEEELNEEEKQELADIWRSLKSRQESKFDAIIRLIKDCDKYIKNLDQEINEIKNNKRHWENKRKCIINIIKAAYEQKLIGSKPTGQKYQATIRQVKSKLVDNYQEWTDLEKKNFTIRKETTITRISNNELLEAHQEDLPDKEKLKEELNNDTGKAPSAAQLIQRVSLTYNLRKRIKTGV